MKKVGIIIMLLVFFGCVRAKVNVETKEPIKVDINMRLDIYQHVVKDVNSIEDDIYGSKDKQFNLRIVFGNVYAADASGDVESAKERRKQRADLIVEYFNKNYVGENKKAYLQVIKENVPSGEITKIENMVKQENSDREIIYKATAQKNGADIAQVLEIFFKDHYERASRGWLFEIYDKDSGNYTWVKK